METMLKFRLELFEKAVAFQILEQTERFRNTIAYVPLFCDTTKLSVRSTNCPRLEYEELDLRGSDKKADLRIVCRSFERTITRDAYFLEIKTSLNYWRKWCQSLRDEKDDGNFWQDLKEYRLKQDIPDFRKGHIFIFYSRNTYLGTFDSSQGPKTNQIGEPRRWFERMYLGVPQIPVDLSTGIFIL